MVNECPPRGRTKGLGFSPVSDFLRRRADPQLRRQPFCSRNDPCTSSETFCGSGRDECQVQPEKPETVHLTLTRSTALAPRMKVRDLRISRKPGPMPRLSVLLPDKALKVRRRDEQQRRSTGPSFSRASQAGSSKSRLTPNSRNPSERKVPRTDSEKKPYKIVYEQSDNPDVASTGEEITSQAKELKNLSFGPTRSDESRVLRLSRQQLWGSGMPHRYSNVDSIGFY